MLRLRSLSGHFCPPHLCSGLLRADFRVPRSAQPPTVSAPASPCCQQTASASRPTRRRSARQLNGKHEAADHRPRAACGSSMTVRVEVGRRNCRLRVSVWFSPHQQCSLRVCCTVSRGPRLRLHYSARISRRVPARRVRLLMHSSQKETTYVPAAPSFCPWIHPD